MLIHLSIHLFIKHMFLCGPIIIAFSSPMRLKDCIWVGDKKLPFVCVCAAIILYKELSYFSTLIRWSVLRDVSDLPKVTHVQCRGLPKHFSFPFLWRHSCQLWFHFHLVLKFPLHTTVREILRIMHISPPPGHSNSIRAFAAVRESRNHPLPYHTPKPSS